MNRRTAAGGFTLIEVLASLLVLAIGILSVVGMIAYAVVQAGRAKASATAMATAMSVMVDPQPLETLDWTHTPASLDGTPGSSTGYLNGFYVVRRELPQRQLGDGIGSSAIQVDVYDTVKGALLASAGNQFVKRSW